MIKVSTNNKVRGFTLVEVLVAVGALAVGSLAFLPSFSASNKEKNLTQSVENAKDAIATARNRALAEVGNPEASNPYRYSGVKFTAGSSTYELFRSKIADVGTCDTLSGVARDGIKTLLGNVVAKIPSGESPTCIFFEFGSGDAYVTKGTTPATANACTN